MCHPDEPPNVTDPRTDIPKVCPWRATAAAARVRWLRLRRPSVRNVPGTHRTVPAPARQDPGLPQPVGQAHGWAGRLGREEVANVMPLKLLQQELGTRRAERREDMVRDVRACETLRQSECPETARRRSTLPGKVDKVRPCEVAGVGDRGHVPQGTPGSPLHP